MVLCNAQAPERMCPSEVDAVFADLVYADPELVAAEFDALIGSAFTPQQPVPPRRTGTRMAEPPWPPQIPRRPRRASTRLAVWAEPRQTTPPQ